MSTGIDIAGLSADITSLAMDLAGTAKTTAILHLAKSNTYDPATDTTTASGGTDVTLDGIFYKSSQKQREITGNEAMFLIQGAGAPTVDEGDTVEIDGKIWQINDVSSVPGKAVIVLGLRK